MVQIGQLMTISDNSGEKPQIKQGLSTSGMTLIPLILAYSISKPHKWWFLEMFQAAMENFPHQWDDNGIH